VSRTRRRPAPGYNNPYRPETPEWPHGNTSLWAGMSGWPIARVLAEVPMSSSARSALSQLDPGQQIHMVWSHLPHKAKVEITEGYRYLPAMNPQANPERVTFGRMVNDGQGSGYGDVFLDGQPVGEIEARYHNFGATSDEFRVTGYSADLYLRDQDQSVSLTEEVPGVRIRWPYGGVSGADGAARKALSRIRKRIRDALDPKFHRLPKGAYGPRRLKPRKNPFAPGDVVGSGRWPMGGGNVPGRPWRGTVLAEDDPRAWAGSLAFPGGDPDPEAVSAHVRKHPLRPGRYPVLWDFGGEEVVHYETEKPGHYGLKPYEEDVEAWQSALSNPFFAPPAIQYVAAFGNPPRRRNPAQPISGGRKVGGARTVKVTTFLPTGPYGDVSGVLTTKMGNRYITADWYSRGVNINYGDPKATTYTPEDAALAHSDRVDYWMDHQGRQIDSAHSSSNAIENPVAKGDWKAAAQQLLASSADPFAGQSRWSQGSGEAFGYRAYLRAVIAGTPAEFLTQLQNERGSGAAQARSDLIDLVGGGALSNPGGFMVPAWAAPALANPLDAPFPMAGAGRGDWIDERTYFRRPLPPGWEWGDIAGKAVVAEGPGGQRVRFAIEQGHGRHAGAEWARGTHFAVRRGHVREWGGLDEAEGAEAFYKALSNPALSNPDSWWRALGHGDKNLGTYASRDKAIRRAKSYLRGYMERGDGIQMRRANQDVVALFVTSYGEDTDDFALVGPA
jgi:hypothetical protein